MLQHMPVNQLQGSRQHRMPGSSQQLWFSSGDLPFATFMGQANSGHHCFHQTQSCYGQLSICSPSAPPAVHQCGKLSFLSPALTQQANLMSFSTSIYGESCNIETTWAFPPQCPPAIFLVKLDSRKCKTPCPINNVGSTVAPIGGDIQLQSWLEQTQPSPPSSTDFSLKSSSPSGHKSAV